MLFKYIGTTSAETHFTDNGGRIGSMTRHTWILREGPFGWRISNKLGANWLGMSQGAQRLEAAVKAWKKGGPLPPLDDNTKVKPPAKVIKQEGGE